MTEQLDNYKIPKQKFDVSKAMQDSRFSMAKKRFSNQQHSSFLLRTAQQHRTMNQNTEYTPRDMHQQHITKNLKDSTLLKRARNCQHQNKTQCKEPQVSKLNLITIYSPDEDFTGDTIINLRSLICTPHYKSQQKFNILNKIPQLKNNEKLFTPNPKFNSEDTKSISDSKTYRMPSPLERSSKIEIVRGKRKIDIDKINKYYQINK